MAYYRKKQLLELLPWTPNMHMALVSVSAEDRANGSPKEGDMIAFNPKDPSDVWLVGKQYFEDNFEFVGDTLEDCAANQLTHL